MRHRIKGRQLNRNTHQRKALFKGLLNSLILREEIQTTQSKAKAIQGVFDKLVTKAKLGTVHVRRLLHAFLGNQEAVKKLVDELAPRMDKRPSGFTRINKLGVRRGDNASVVKMSLVDQKEESKTPAPKSK
ncbi:MAG: hypothetical protein ACD_27C00048G0002 [uncultured bacterium]|nr:MAG: hypothetical protein ACD_27C00048G0002 [uncultured bacterium]